jgi:hypothetical protein
MYNKCGQVNMKKILFFGLFLNSFFVIFAQNIVLNPEKEKNLQHGISKRLDDNSPVFGTVMSRVVNMSNDPKDNRNFGRYVEMTFFYNENGNAIEVHIIYSNLKKINASIGDVVTSRDIVGYSGGGGTNIHKNNDLYIYIYTTENCQTLKNLTKSSFFYEDEVYWWNPAFLYPR